jgi:hypothetical protein
MSFEKWETPHRLGERLLAPDEALNNLDELLAGLDGDGEIAALPKLGPGACKQCGDELRRRYLYFSREFCRRCVTSRLAAGRRVASWDARQQDERVQLLREVPDPFSAPAPARNYHRRAA